MSLVNRVLRDLDARRAGPDERAALPAAVTPLAARQQAGISSSWRWLGAALLAGLGLAAWYSAPTPEAQAPAPAPAAARPAAVVPTVAPAEAATIAAVPAPMVVPESTLAPEPALLRLADELVATPAALPRHKPNGPTPPQNPAAPSRVPKADSVANAADTPAPAAVAAEAAPPRAQLVVLPKVPPEPREASIDKQVRLPSAVERAEAEYRRALQAQRQGHADEAINRFRAALDEHPEHAAARQTLAAQLIEAKRFDEAEELLRKGTELPAVRLGSTLALARLKVERHQAPAALELLQKNAAAGERSAEYHGFAGALLNRAGRAAEAVEHYQTATRLAPAEGRWWAGLGIALEANGKTAEAREAYQKGRALPNLPADLAQHIDQRLR